MNSINTNISHISINLIYKKNYKKNYVLRFIKL